MAQEWDEDYRQEMEMVIDLLEECDIDFKVEGDKILTKGDVEYALL